MALAAGGVSLLVILVALVWGGIRPGGFGPPPVITAPTKALRVAPANPGGMEVPGADVPIMSGEDNLSSTPQLAPAASAPALAQLEQAAGLNQPAPQATPAPAAAPPQAQAPSGPVGVQLAATVDESGAETVWNQLKQKFPDLLSGKSPNIIPAVVNGQSVWRLRLSGFDNADAAKAFCATLTAKGAACTVVAF
jgi:hypothetical protein